MAGPVPSGDDRIVRVWNVEVAECVASFEGHGNWVLSVASVTPDLVLSGSLDCTLKLWSVVANAQHA